MQHEHANKSAAPVPQHVAIIMDGNGRWATARGLPRTAGHKKGADTVRLVVKAAAELNIEYLTLFAFSAENWLRPKAEVDELMRLLRFYLRSEIAELHRNDVRVRVIGDRSRLGDDIVAMIERAEVLTQNNGRITVIIALNYGGRQDVTQAAIKLVQSVQAGEMTTAEITEEALSSRLHTQGIPDPDLIIRTSGEHRISNFLLWQGAYAELVFVETLWPDFSSADLSTAVEEYQSRDRRFGASAHAQ